MKGHSAEHLAMTPQHSQGHESRGKTEKLSQTRGHEGTRMTTRSEGCWTGSRNRKSTQAEKLVKAKQNLELS